jgi:hypothetical protein
MSAAAFNRYCQLLSWLPHGGELELCSGKGEAKHSFIGSRTFGIGGRCVWWREWTPFGVLNRNGARQIYP